MTNSHRVVTVVVPAISPPSNQTTTLTLALSSTETPYTSTYQGYNGTDTIIVGSPIFTSAHQTVTSVTSLDPTATLYTSTVFGNATDTLIINQPGSDKSTMVYLHSGQSGKIYDFHVYTIS